MYYYFMTSISGYYGSGSVFEVVNNGKHVWRAVKPLQSVDGRRRFITGTGDTRDAALRALEKNTQKRITQQITPRHKATPTVSEYMETWKQRDEVQASTKKKQLSDMRNHIIGPLGNVQLSRLDQQTLQPIVTDLTEKHSAGWHALTTLSAMLGYAVKQGIIPANPMRAFTIERKTTAVKDDDDKYITPRTNIYWRLMARLAKPENVHHDEYPMFLIAGLGLRPSEVIGLTWDCISQLNAKGKASITVKQQLARHVKEVEGITGYYLKDITKNKKKRTIPLPEPWRKALIEEKRKNRKGFQGEWSTNLVFLKPSGRHWLRQGFSTEWHRILKEYTADSNAPAAVKDWRVYFIRHTAVSLLTRDASSALTADIVGNSAEITESIYRHAMQEAMGEAMQKFEKRTVERYLKDEHDLIENGTDDEGGD
jgi:integrase